jgi:nitrogenase molybdenum-iron protein alpha chain
VSARGGRGMSRDAEHDALYSYDGTVKDFCSKACGPNKDRAAVAQMKKNRPACDLTSCPLDGAYLALSKIGGLTILFNSPPGCCVGLWILWGGAYSLKSVEGTKRQTRCVTLCTNMGEEDVVYGGEPKLYRALEDIAKRLRPPHVCVLSSCCPGIIGDDVAKVVERAGRELGMDIGALDTSGFSSSYWPNGYDLAHGYIIDHLMEPLEVDEKTINLIPYGNAAAVDERECARILTALGLTVQTPLAVPYTELENVRAAPRAKATTMMCMTFGWNFARQMKRRFGTAIIEDSHPLSMHFTTKWLMAVAKEFGCTDRAAALVREETAAISSELAELRAELRGKRIAITAGHDKMPSLLALAKELEMEPVYAGLVTYDNLVEDKLREMSEAFDHDFSLVVYPQTHEEVPTINRLDPDVYVGPAGLTPKNVMMGIPSVSTHFNDFIGPYFGFAGVVTFGREILNAIRDPLPHYAPDAFVIRGPERVCGETWFKQVLGR